MKNKFNFKWLLLSIILSIASINTASATLYLYMTGSGTNPGEGSKIATFGGDNNAIWISNVNNSARRFYVNVDDDHSQDWFNNTSWGPNNTVQIYDYGENNYNHALSMTPVNTGVYRFSTWWDNNARWFKYQPYIIVGNGSGNWLGGYSWILSQTSNIATSSKTYSNCAAGLKTFRIIPYAEWDQAHGYSQVSSCNVPYYTNEDNNIAFVTVAQADITIGFDGTNITINVEYDSSDLNSVKKSILNNDKIMFYYGAEWGVRDNFYVNVNNTSTHLATNAKGCKVNINSRDNYLAVAQLPSATYSLSDNSGWNGVSTGSDVSAGAIYALYADNGEHIRKTNGVAPTWTSSTNISIAKGTTNSGLAATCSNSSLGRANTITYYYTQDNGTTWTEFNPASVASLAVGTYTVRALAFDDNIYVRTESAATLTVYASITLDNHGADSGKEGTQIVQAVKGATATAITKPEKTGYIFQGYYTGENGTGSKVIDANGTWVANISGYTDNSSPCKYNATSNQTLHAKWTPVTWQLQSTGSGSPHGTFTGSGDGPYTLDVTYNSSTMNWGAARFDLNGTSYICNNYAIGTDGKLDLRAANAYTAISGMTNGASYTFTITYESGTWYVQIAENCTAPTIAWNTTPANGVAGGNMTASVTTNQTSPTITWNSSNTSAATVNSSGVITYVAAGNTRITASYTGDGSTYCSTTASVYQDITVSAAVADAWSLWYWGVSETKIGDFTPDGGDSHHLDFELTASNFQTLWLKNNSTQYVATNIIANTVTNVPVTESPVGRFRDDATKGHYRFTIYKDGGGAWKLDASPIYRVTYNDNGATSGTVPTDAAGYASGATVTVKGNTGSLAKTGYDFGGWNLAADGSGTNYTAGSGTFSITANTELFAKWNVQSYTITYKDQGDVAFSGNHVESPSSHPTTHTYGTATSLNSATKTGYTFGGWFTTSNCASGTDVTSLGATDYTSNITLYAKWTEVMRTITINGGTAASTTAGVATTGSATAAAPAAGKKFTGWTLGDGVALSGGALTDRTINFTATQASSVTANYADRASVKMYFAKPTTLGWSKVYAYAWGPSGHNDTYPGVELSTTEVINCVTYYIYQYYTEADGIGGAATGDATWNKIVFGDNNDARKTGDLNIADGHYYYRATTANTSGKSSAITAAWYIKGTMNSWGETDPITHDCVNNKGTVNINLTKGNTYEFKVYNEVNNQMWSNSTACGTSSGDHTITETMASAETLYNDDANVMKVTANVTGPYTFEVSATNASNPKIKVTFPVSYTVNFGVSPAAAADAPTNSLSISSGSLVLSGTSITFTKDPTPNPGYTWSRWEKNSSNVGTGDTYTTTISGTTTVNAVYTEDTHTVTLANGGHGHVEIGGATVTSVSGVGIATASGTITAVPDPGYYFTGWTGDINNGVTFASGDASSTSITINATADSKTITANFAPIWRLVGSMNSWNDGTNPLLNYSTEGGKNYVYVEVSLNANTQYSFKVKNVQTTKMYKPTSSNTEITYANKATAQGMNNTVDGNPNQTIMTAAAGTYRFTWNITDKSIKVTYPASCKVTFGMGTGGLTITASGSTTGSISSGNYVASGENVTFTETHTDPGYTLTGWYTTKDTGGSSVTGMSTSDFVLDDIAADATVWSRYSENMTTVNLSASPAGKGTFTCGGDAVTSVSAGVTTHPAVTAVPATGYRVNTSATVWSESSDYISLSSTSTNPTTITATGTTGNSATLTATFTPKTYTITLNQNGATTESDPTSLTATYDAKANGASDVFTLTNPERTGYTFRGWNTEADTSGTIIVTWAKYYEWNTAYVDNDGRWIHDGDVEVFAMWKSNEYTVTFDYDETGYGSAGSGVKSSVTATYGKAMPTMGTAPTPAPGYKFMGYFTDHNGAGTKYYNADGSSAANWNIAEATTLYAHFQKTVISSLEHPAAVAKGDVVTVDVNPVFNQTGAQPNMAICWSLLYDTDTPVDGEYWSVASYTEGGSKPDQVRFTLTGMSSGYYKIKAVLYANSSVMATCDDGTELSTIKSDLRIAGNSKVTIQYQDASGNTILANGSVEVARGDEVEVTAPDIIGYEFSTWALGDVLHTEGALTANPIIISADYDGYLTAKYTKKQMIYFNNTLEWEDVYVYFYNDGSGNQYWADGYGTGANQAQYFNGNQPYFEGEHGHMTQIEGTNIWYFDFKAEDWYSTTRTKVAFANVEQSINETTDDNAKIYFHNASVVYRTDFDVANLPMFVPINSVVNDYTANTGSKYYRGYWMNYPESTGYTLKIFDNTGGSASLVKERDFPFSADKAMPMSVTVDLEGGNKTYGFKIYRVDNKWYSNGGTMTNGHSGDTGQAVWGFGDDVSDNCGLTTTSAGNYTFKLDFNSGGYYQVGVHYPESTGDFRVMYTDDVRIDNHDDSEGASWLLSSVIPGNTASDTISYFVRAENSKNPKYKIQKCTITEAAREEDKEVRWADQGIAIDVPDSITENGVYNFIFAKNDGNLVLQKIEPYEGNFYIRVDGAGSSNWDNFRASDHLMPYSDYSFHQTENPYSHYFTQWYKVEKVGGDVKVKNIKFVVANDYSVNVSDTIVQDDVAGAYVDANGYITRSANIRFMYNYKTNEATRRYVDGAQESGSEFLMIIPGNSKIYAAAEGGDPLTQLTFSDKGNWVYEANVYALPTATYKLKSKFGATATGDASKDWERKGEIIQYFKGGESSTETLIGGNSESTTRVQIRLLYDFKTNRVVAAYQPSSGTIDANMEINADIMFMREHQGDIEQITFAEGKSISAIENIYCCLKFNKYTLNNLDKNDPSKLLSPLLSRYERDIFYVSFPYDVRVSDIIGFGTYGQHWIVEYYDGAARAKNGFWADTETYWRFVTPAMKDNFVMKAGTGYIVALDLDEMWYINNEHHADIWNNTTEVELLFPGDVSSISNQKVKYTMPQHTCTINRGEGTSGDRRIKDSHWNVLGVPVYHNLTGGEGNIDFKNTTWLSGDSLGPKFIYDGNLADNSLTPKAAADFEFKAMHAYVVQYHGDVEFTTSTSPAPAIVARRTYAEKPIDLDFRLELNKNGIMEDQTFISLSNDENVSAGFAFGEDLSKEFNTNRANIYTFIGTEWVAGNTLPMSEQTTVVPVGVKIASAGDYTFAIPEGTNGVGVTLIDNETGIRTSLSALDYTINLPAGTYDNRFVLEISPIVQSPTGIESTEHRTQNTDVHKVLIDNILYIVKDGVMYDARGARVQ